MDLHIFVKYLFYTCDLQKPESISQSLLMDLHIFVKYFTLVIYNFLHLKKNEKSINEYSSSFHNLQQ